MYVLYILYICMIYTHPPPPPHPTPHSHTTPQFGLCQQQLFIKASSPLTLSRQCEDVLFWCAVVEHIHGFVTSTETFFCVFMYMCFKSIYALALKGETMVTSSHLSRVFYWT